MTEYDVIVFGLGGIGSAAAYWLRSGGAARAGHRAVRARPRARRVARPLAHHPVLVFCTAPYVAARESGVRGLGAVGGAMPASRSSSKPAASTSGRATARFRSRHTPTRCAPATYRSSGSTPQRFADAGRRLADRRHVHGLFQADGGIVAAQRATAAHQRMARAARRDAARATPVTALRAADGEIDVEAGGERYRAAASDRRGRPVERARSRAVRRARSRWR